ncbi:MAG TPA: alpha/beta fold hydrolase [Pelomicrobium sp.]|nr:alpha/beta fold hydrolase [Pelomicrobium sp.]
MSPPLHLERVGTGEGLVMLHGYSMTGRSLLPLAGAFAADYEVLVPDLPGHGASSAAVTRPGYDFDACIDDVLATVESTGHERCHWFGYSMGARIALACALRRPDRVASLMLLAGRAGIADKAERKLRRAADNAVAARIERDGLEAFVDDWMALPIFETQWRLGPRFIDAVRRERLSNSAEGLAGALRAMGPAAQPPLFDALGALDAPVLCMAGALDVSFVDAARDLAARLPRGEFAAIPDAGHAAHTEQAAAVIAAMSEILRRAGGPADT